MAAPGPGKLCGRRAKKGRVVADVWARGPLTTNAGQRMRGPALRLQTYQPPLELPLLLGEDSVEIMLGVATVHLPNKPSPTA